MDSPLQQNMIDCALEIFQIQLEMLKFEWPEHTLGKVFY